MLKAIAASIAVSTLIASLAHADKVTVRITGQVSFNAISDPPLSGVGFGDNVEMTFTVDSSNFLDGIAGDTRGYVIDESSFSLSFDTPVSLGLQNPFPAGQTPYFTLVDGFPVSDGFFVSPSPISPSGVPLDQSPFHVNLDLGYTGSVLDSLDILDAQGVYNFSGLTSFKLNLWSIIPDNVQMDIDFSQMDITAVPEPSAPMLLCFVGGLAVLGKRIWRESAKSHSPHVEPGGAKQQTRLDRPEFDEVSP